MSHPGNILLVGTEPDHQNLFSLMLRTAGHSVVLAPNAETALNLLDRERFHIMMTDLRLPLMQGDVLIGIVVLQYPATKTLLLDTGRNLKKIATQAGATAWLNKLDAISALCSVVAFMLTDVILCKDQTTLGDID